MSKLRVPQVPMARLHRRLRYLRDWEAANVVLLTAYQIPSWRSSDAPIGWSLRMPPLLLMSFVLFQGTLYWHWKLRSVRDRAPLPNRFCGIFRAFYRATLIGLLLIPAGIAAAIAGGMEIHAGDLEWAVGLWAFTVLEVVNYYHWQLIHDSRADWRYLLRHRRLRRAPLASDLRAQRGLTSPAAPLPQ